jgi:hypothetical protein
MTKSENKANTQEKGRRLSGIYSGLLAAFLLGWAPILGKLACITHARRCNFPLGHLCYLLA